MSLYTSPLSTRELLKSGPSASLVVLFLILLNIGNLYSNYMLFTLKQSLMPNNFYPKYNRNLSQVCLLSWLCSLLFEIPLFMFYEGARYVEPLGQCVPEFSVSLDSGDIFSHSLFLQGCIENLRANLQFYSYNYRVTIRNLCPGVVKSIQI